MLTTIFVIAGTWCALLNANSSLRCQRNDLHEPALAQFASYGPEDPGADGFALSIDQDRSVIVEPDERAICPANALGCAHDNRSANLALLHPRVGHRILHRNHDDVSNRRVTPPGSSEHADARNLARSRVVCDFEY
jgi:hypothetical protein